MCKVVLRAWKKKYIYIGQFVRPFGISDLCGTVAGMVTPKGSMSTEGETLPSFCPTLHVLDMSTLGVCLGCCAAEFGSSGGTYELHTNIHSAAARVGPWPCNSSPIRYPYPLPIFSAVLHSAVTRSPSRCCLPISVVVLFHDRINNVHFTLPNPSSFFSPYPRYLWVSSTVFFFFYELGMLAPHPTLLLFLGLGPAGNQQLGPRMSYIIFYIYQF